MRESQAAGNIHVGWTPAERNLVDLLTKNTMDGNAWHLIVEMIFHDNAVTWKDDKNYGGRVG